MAGDVIGKAGDGATVGEGGMALFENANPVGVRADLKFEDTTGVRWVLADQPAPLPARVTVSAEIDAEVLLAAPITGIDFTAAPGVLATLLTAIAAQLEHVTRIVLISEAIVGLVSHATVRAQTDASLPANLAAAQSPTFTAANQIRELVLASPRPGIDAGPSTFDEAILESTVAAVATTYTITAQIWGLVVTP